MARTEVAVLCLVQKNWILKSSTEAYIIQNKFLKVIIILFTLMMIRQTQNENIYENTTYSSCKVTEHASFRSGISLVVFSVMRKKRKKNSSRPFPVILLGAARCLSIGSERVPNSY